MALLAGFAAGLVGAIPPGPVNFNVIRRASRYETREALRLSLGAALVDAVICVTLAAPPLAVGVIATPRAAFACVPYVVIFFPT